MRDALMFLAVFGSLPFILKRPMVGVLMFAWVSLMNPHRLAYGAAYDFPFAMLLAIVTFLSVMMSREPKHLPMTPIVVTMLVFITFATVTSFVALEPLLVWREWNRVSKTFLMTFLTIFVLRNEKDIKALALVVVLSLGFYGFKGGLFTILSGGSNRVLGPASSYITDNNALALAMVVTVPLLCYQYMSANKRWIKYGFGALIVLTICGAVGSYSRGALVGGGAMLTFLWLKGQHKVRTGIALALVAPLVYMLMPPEWFGRMETIENYTEDASAMGRINAWQFAINLANDNLLGGGYNTFSKTQFALYAPNPLDYHVAHSIYFQVLGEHGYIGLAIYLLLMVLAWRSGTRIIRYCRQIPEQKWAVDLATMCQVSIVGYAVGGAFLSLAYYDLYYYVISILVLLEKVLLPSARNGIKAPPAPVRAAGKGAR